MQLFEIIKFCFLIIQTFLCLWHKEIKKKVTPYVAISLVNVQTHKSNTIHDMCKWQTSNLYWQLPQLFAQINVIYICIIWYSQYLFPDWSVHFPRATPHLNNLLFSRYFHVYLQDKHFPSPNNTQRYIYKDKQLLLCPVCTSLGGKPSLWYLLSPFFV